MLIVLLTLLDQSEDKVVLLLGLDGHEVHAVLPADVPRFQPIDFGRLVLLRVSAVEVIASFVRELLGSWKNEKHNAVTVTTSLRNKMVFAYVDLGSAKNRQVYIL